MEFLKVRIVSKEMQGEKSKNRWQIGPSDSREAETSEHTAYLSSFDVFIRFLGLVETEYTWTKNFMNKKINGHKLAT